VPLSGYLQPCSVNGPVPLIYRIWPKYQPAGVPGKGAGIFLGVHSTRYLRRAMTRPGKGSAHDTRPATASSSRCSPNSGDWATRRSSSRCPPCSTSSSGAPPPPMPKRPGGPPPIAPSPKRPVPPAPPPSGAPTVPATRSPAPLLLLLS
jgi:hypothetical protein